MDSPQAEQADEGEDVNLNDYSDACYAAAHHWWFDEDDNPIKRNKGELFILMVSEICEAMEGERKGQMDKHLPHRKAVEVELADALIRIFEYGGAFHFDLEGALVEKMAYNAQREDHTHEARARAGGKKW